MNLSDVEKLWLAAKRQPVHCSECGRDVEKVPYTAGPVAPLARDMMRMVRLCPDCATAPLDFSKHWTLRRSLAAQRAWARQRAGKTGREIDWKLVEEFVARGVYRDLDALVPDWRERREDCP